MSEKYWSSFCWCYNCVGRKTPNLNIMQTNDNTFEVLYNKIPVRITPGKIGESTSYTASYGGAPIILTRATDANGTQFWASIPEVNYSLVEGLGSLIQEHLNSKE